MHSLNIQYIRNATPLCFTLSFLKYLFQSNFSFMIFNFLFYFLLRTFELDTLMAFYGHHDNFHIILNHFNDIRSYLSDILSRLDKCGTNFKKDKFNLGLFLKLLQGCNYRKTDFGSGLTKTDPVHKLTNTIQFSSHFSLESITIGNMVTRLYPLPELHY